ncbi:MAG: thioredoxin family protein [Patescibacteria group bacterium]
MNKNILIIAAIILVLGGGFLLLRKGSPPTSQTTNVPRNPEGVINQEVESSNYKPYSKTGYEKALAQKKVTMLYFTANWCPICREQEPINMETLEELSEDKDIIAFRVHILDSETTPEGEKLADDFTVRYQHTTIILDSEGKIASTTTGPLTKEELRSKLLAAK